jgi:hypothetical protein
MLEVEGLRRPYGALASEQDQDLSGRGNPPGIVPNRLFQGQDLVGQQQSARDLLIRPGKVPDSAEALPGFRFLSDFDDRIWACHTVFH